MRSRVAPAPGGAPGEQQHSDEVDQVERVPERWQRIPGLNWYVDSEKHNRERDERRRTIVFIHTAELTSVFSSPYSVIRSCTA